MKLLPLLFILLPIYAETYWVSPTGAATWANCDGATPLSGTAACTLYTANNNAVAGDTIYLRGGTYTFTSSSGCGNNYSCGIFPKNRGTLNARITYSAYTGETPVLTADGTAPTYTSGVTIMQGTAEAGTYIRVTGITFVGIPNWVSIYNYGSYNEIDHNIFYSETGQDFYGAAGISIVSICAGSAGYTCYSKHNWIHHNTMAKVHEYGDQSCHEGADLIRIGHGYPSSDPADNATSVKDDYNTVEDNVLSYAGHAIMDTYGGFNVVRGNIMHNEGWITDYSGGTCAFPPMPNGKYGHRGLQTSEDYGRPAQSVLVEGNRFGFSSANPNNPGEANYAIASSATIVRYNYSFAAHQSGIGTKWYRGFEDGISTTLSENIDASVTTIPVASTAGLTSTAFYLRIEDEYVNCTGKTASSFTGCTRSSGVSHSSGAATHVNGMANRGQGGNGPYKVRIYNNTSFYNGQTYPYMWTAQDGCSTCPGKLAGFNVYSLAKDVLIKNNIATSNKSVDVYGFDVTVNSNGNPSSYASATTVANNYCTSAQTTCTGCCTASGNPLFVNPDLTDPTSATLPNLALQATSPAINGGTYLTQAAGAGSNTVTLIVDDAMYFQDGTWGSDLARGVTFFPDEIAIGTVGNTVAISAINYATNTITLASAKTWADDAPIWLYKKSDGAVVLNGSAPDYGASEFMGNPTTLGGGTWKITVK
jgi:hypothetical protein